MPDWESVLREKLAGLALAPKERREVISELAAHLAEAHEAHLRQGVPAEEAVQRTLVQAGDWEELRLRIEISRSKENVMTDRVKQVWLPGFVTLFLSMMLLLFVQLVGPQALFVSMHGWRIMAPVAVVYIPWLLLLLPIGAIGSYMASRAGASRRAMLLAIAFPVLPYFVFFILALPAVLILGDHVAHNIMFSALFTGLFAWVLAPGLALLAGGLPTQIILARTRRTQRVASA
jgi:hypothetical protein